MTRLTLNGVVQQARHDGLWTVRGEQRGDRPPVAASRPLTAQLLWAKSASFTWRASGCAAPC